jgi:hypothetical protein
MTQHIYWLSNQTPFTLYFENSQSSADATSALPGVDVMTGGADGNYCNVPDCSAQPYFYANHMNAYAVDADNNVIFSFSFWANDANNETLQYSYDGVYFNVQNLPTYNGDVTAGFGIVITYDSDAAVAAIAAYAGQTPESKSALPFAFGEQDFYPNISSAVWEQQIMAAEAGGQATAAFFTEQNQLYQFVQYVNGAGQAAWISSTDADGNPCMIAILEGGTQEDTISMVVTGDAVPGMFDTSQAAAVETPPTDPRIQAIIAAAYQNRPSPNRHRYSRLTGDQGAGGFTWAGGNYNTVASITTTLVYNDTPAWYLTVPLGLASTVGTYVLRGVIWSALLGPILRGLVVGLEYLFQGLVGLLPAGSAAQVLAAITARACLATTQNGALAGVTFSITGGLAVAGVVVLIALPIILGLVMHESSQTLRFYNLTLYDIQWTLANIVYGVLSSGPASSVGSPFVLSVIPAGQYITMGQTQTLVYREADFSWASNSQIHGIQYILALTITDPANNGALVANAAIAFNIPWSGENSLAATFSPPSDITDLYNSTQQELSEAATQALANGQTLTLTVTYDYLDGEHPLPSGQPAYTYNSLVVLSTA